MVVLLDIPSETLDRLKTLAKEVRMSRKAYMELILIEHSHPNSRIETGPKTDSEIKLVQDFREGEEVNQQIKAIILEKIPKERDTRLGRPVWFKEQQQRIDKLRSKLG